VYLTVHAYRHLWERIEWINDINYLINKNKNEIDWDTVLAISKKIGSLKALNETIFLCQVLFDNKFLKEKFPNLNNKKHGTAFNIFIKNFKNYIKNDSPSNIECFYIYNRLLDKYKYKFIHLFSVFKINDRDLDFILLPERYYFLYYFIKPYRLIKSVFK